MNGAFGVSPFGFAPFGDVTRPAASVTFTGVATLTVDFDFRIFTATQELITGPDDSPANTAFGGSLSQAVRFTRSIIGDGFGGFIAGQGEMTIQNTSGEYDFLAQRYALDGRDVVVKFGRREDDYRDWFTVFTGTAADFHVDEDEFRVDLQDYGFKLDVPLQEATYGGTGGADGGEDLAGKRKPRAFGYVENIAPPLVVPNSLIYQVNDGPVQAVSAVYVRGLALTGGTDHANYAALAAASITSGQFHTCLALGLFRINFLLDGEVTADVSGDASGSGFTGTRSGIVRRILTLATEIADPAGLYLPSFTVYETAQPGEIGHWFDHNSTDTVADAIGRVIGPSAWAGFRRDGKFEAMAFDLPSGIPVMRLAKEDIRDIRREKLPAGLSPPPWRWRVAYSRNWTVITDPAGAVTEDRRAFLAEEFRYAVAESEPIRVDHPLALERTVDGSGFRDLADAQAEAERLLTLHKRSAALYRLQCDLEPLSLNIGQVILVTFPRFDLTSGRLLRVVELTEDAREGSVEIVGFG